MARLPRLFVPGLPVHVLQGAAREEAIAPDAEARDALQDILSESVRSHGLALHAFALMPNHFHLLASASEPETLARTLQSLGRRYVQFFNRRTQRRGTLWDGRYRSCVIQAERYLLKVSRYIELNPVRNGLVAAASEYPWTSYRHHVGLESCSFITEHPAYWALGNTPFERQKIYRDQSGEGVLEADVQAIRRATRGGWALGEPDFLTRTAGLAQRRTAPLPRGRPANPPAKTSSD